MGRVAGIGGRRGACRVLVRRPEGRSPLGKPIHRWDGNIKMDLTEVGWGPDWVVLSQDSDRWQTLVNVIINLGVP
jgi:hypothetical protein